MQTTTFTKLVRFVVPGIVPLAIAVVLACAVLARATTFAVNSTIDATDATPGDGSCETAPGNGVCTLRAAVEETNALAGPDIVTVPAGTYSSVSGALVVSDDVTVAGAGTATTVIDCGPTGGIVVGAVTARIGGVTIRHCNAGYGAISNRGTLTVSDSVVSDNPVSGIYNEGTLTVERVTVRRNTAGGVGGGGIASSIDNTGIGQLTVVDSTIADNSAYFFGGGVLVLFGTATISNTTISGNTAVYGGGISAGGCALGCTSAAVYLDNVTITNNSVSTGDGGGVAVLGDGGDAYSILSMRNTVVAGNSDQGGQAPDCGTFGTVLISEGYNLIGNPASCVIYGDGTGNLTGVNAQLGPLQDNGGPTPTHAPLSGSPAIDAGNPAAPGGGGAACEALDQRGVMRPQGARCDIGAVEVGATPTTTSTTTSSTTSTTLPPFCAATPRGDCEIALPAKASLLIKDRSDDGRDRLAWKWRSNGSVATPDFGSPTTTSDYAVCVYDQSGAGSTLRMDATAPAGGVCAGKPCWRALTTGFLYADRQLTPDGLRTIRLHAGDAAHGTITVKGRGAPLPLPSLPLGVPVTVQLQRRDVATCWSATFSAPATNTVDELKAKGD
jgi:hypothetical protein